MWFSPHFSYSHEIVNRLTRITASREVILHAHLVPKWEVSLRREQLVRAAHASTAIEGNPLTLEEVSRLAEGRRIMAGRKAQAEVLNYLKVLGQIDTYQNQGNITIETLLRLHRDVTGGTLEDPADEGAFRKVQVVVGNRVTRTIVYTAPPPGEVVPLVEAFIAWLNAEEARSLHPFVDGNGRVARALATLILALRKFDIKRFFTLDDFYDSDRLAYYRVLQEVNRTYPDCTVWLEYFTEGVEVSLHRVKERVPLLSGEEHKKSTSGQIALTERQMQIIEYLHLHGSVKSSDIARICHISRQAALNELNAMREKGLLAREGEGRGVRYLLA